VVFVGLEKCQIGLAAHNQEYPTDNQRKFRRVGGGEIEGKR